jgi:hypothetical protein
MVLMVLLLPLSLCCMSGPPHPCCKDRCAMAPRAQRLVAIAPAKPRIDVLIVFAAPPSLRTNAARDIHLAPAGAAALPCFHPTATIQLRI